MSYMDTAQLRGDLGAFAGSIAVLATLIHLAVQVKQAKRQLAVAGMQTRAHHARGALEDIINSDELVEIFAKPDFIDYGDYGLTKEETIRLSGIWIEGLSDSAYGIENAG